MDIADEFRKGLNALRRGVTRAARQRGGGGRVNVADRRNVVVAGSSGDNGNLNAVSATQQVRIRQDETGTDDVSADHVEMRR